MTWGQNITVQDSAGLSGTALTVGWGGYNSVTVCSGANLALSATAGLYIVAAVGSVTVYGSLAIAGSLQCDWSGALLVACNGMVAVQPGASVNAGNGDPAQYFGWGNWGPPSSITVDWGGDLFVDYASTVDVQEGQMTIASGGSLTVHGVLAANWYGSINVNGGATIISGGQLNLGGPLNGTLNVGAGGTCAIAGILTVFNNGIISIDPAGTFAIQPGATLDLDPAASLGFTISLGPGVSPSNVRYGVPVGNTTGTCYVPTASDVRVGVLVDATTGTCYVPAASDVRFGVNDDAGTGTCYVPAAGSVALGVPVDATIGTAVLSESTVQTALAAMSIDGISWARAMRALLALVAGTMIVADNGDGTNTATCYAQDGTTVAWTARFSTSTGARPSAAIGA